MMVPLSCVRGGVLFLSSSPLNEQAVQDWLLPRVRQIASEFRLVLAYVGVNLYDKQVIIVPSIAVRPALPFVLLLEDEHVDLLMEK